MPNPSTANLPEDVNQVKPFVSIVTPFYNTAKYLRECIESVIKQTHSHFEYILVNNQSSDGSAEIAEEYVGRDGRIRLIHTPRFFTQLENYNFTLTLISPQSQYCKMVQADDWIFPRCIEEMVAVGESHPHIGLISSYRLVGTTVSGCGIDPSRTHFTGKEAGQLLLSGKIVALGSPTTLMYRSNLIHNNEHFYPAHCPHFDTESAYQILKENDFGFAHQVLSYTRLDDASISGQIRRYSPHLIDFLIVVEKYAPAFFAGDALKQARDAIRREYYSFLVRSALLGEWGGKFWKYQLRGLRGAGIKAPKRLLLATLVREGLDIVFNPKKALGDILKIRRLSKGTKAA